MELNAVIALAGILGSGFSAYMGVRIALAEVRSDIRHLQSATKSLDTRVERLEAPYFERRGRNE